MEMNSFHVRTDHESLKHMEEVADHDPWVRRGLEFINSCQYTVTYRKCVWNDNADMRSRLPLPTEHHRSERTSISPPDPTGVSLARAYDLQAYESPTPGADLGGLVRHAVEFRWDALPLTYTDLQGFWGHEPRSTVDILCISDGNCVARSSSAVFTASVSSAHLYTSHAAGNAGATNNSVLSALACVPLSRVAPPATNVSRPRV